MAAQNDLAEVLAGAPILLRVNTSAGHGGGKPTTKAIDEATDRLAFIEGALGLADRPATGPAPVPAPA